MNINTIKKIVLIAALCVTTNIAIAAGNATPNSNTSAGESKADGNNGRIQDLESEDILLHERINEIQLKPGLKGDKGDTGLTGSKGDKGDTGLTGPQGPAGTDGILLSCDSGKIPQQGEYSWECADLPGGIGSTGATYRWTVWSNYDRRQWTAGSNLSLFGGVSSDSWTNGGLASDMSPDKDILRSFFNRKGYAGKNAMIFSDEFLANTSHSGKNAAALFRIKNTTDFPISWDVSAHFTASPPWGDYASIAINGDLIWKSGGYLLGYSVPITTTIIVPPNRISTVVFITASGPGAAIVSTIYSRASFLAIVNDSLELPLGLEYVDDLDIATGGWER